MKRSLLVGVGLATLALSPRFAGAAELEITGGALVSNVLQDHVGQRVTLLLDSGTELTGTLKTVLQYSVQLHEVAGKEFFDAVVDMKKIEGVLIRTAGE